MKEQLLAAWKTHHQMNQLLINNISDAGFAASLSSKSGRTVFQQLLHLQAVRLQWLDVIDKNVKSKLVAIDKTMSFDRKKLLTMLDQSALAIEGVLAESWDKGGKLKGFKKGVIVFLSYLVSHESHHRGNILLTLKQSGEKIPDTLKWGLWEWNR